LVRHAPGLHPFEGYPTPAETLAGRGFCKTACTILRSKD